MGDSCARAAYLSPSLVHAIHLVWGAFEYYKFRVNWSFEQVQNVSLGIQLSAVRSLLSIPMSFQKPALFIPINPETNIQLQIHLPRPYSVSASTHLYVYPDSGFN